MCESVEHNDRCDYDFSRVFQLEESLFHTDTESLYLTFKAESLRPGGGRLKLAHCLQKIVPFFFFNLFLIGG